MDLTSIQENQRVYMSMAKNRIPVGFTHHMTPNSIYKLLTLLGKKTIENSVVMDVGCGQGFVLYHMLKAGAKKAIGTDWDETVLKNTVPFEAYNPLVKQNKILDLRSEDFGKKRSHLIDKDCSIVTMFIGDNALVERLLTLFEKKKHLKAIAFMRPTRGFDYDEWFAKKIEKGLWTVEEFTLVLSGSQERRQSFVVHKEGEP